METTIISTDAKDIPPKVTTLDELIKELYKVFESDKVNVEYVEELMRNYNSNPKEWKKFAKFDRYKYTRNLIDEGNGKFNLMMLCWGPSQQSNIHDHADSHCFMKAMDGALEETRFEFPEDAADEQMKELGRASLKTNEVVYINDSLGVHRVANLSHTEGAVSMHLYSPPYSECLIFDERTCKKTKCCVTFWSKFGVRCSANPKKELEC